MKLKEENKKIGQLYKGMDEHLITLLDNVSGLVERNKAAMKDLLEKTKLVSQGVEYKRRMVAASQPLLKNVMMTLWVDPDRGNFHPVDSPDRELRGGHESGQSRRPQQGARLQQALHAGEATGTPRHKILRHLPV